MVHLEFTIPINANLRTVWAYFSRFEVVPEWDPNTVSVRPLKKTSQQVGSQYEVNTLFNGKASVVHYVTVYCRPYQMISFEGRNKQVTTLDDIIFTPVNQRITNITYRANITLNGFRCLFTPFIRSSLQGLAQTARMGMIRRSQEMFGRVMI